MDDFCNKVMRLLLIEQFRNSEIQKIYDRWMFVEPLAFQSKVFSALIELSIISAADCEYLAVKYYAPIYFLHKNGYLMDFCQKNEKIFRNDAYKHIVNFFAEVGVA